MPKSLIPVRPLSADVSETELYQLDSERGDSISDRLGLEHVIFSFGPIPDPEEVAVEGWFRVHEAYDPFWGKGEPYRKEFLNPTWGELYRAADDCIRVTGDRHHVYLENILQEGRRLVFCFGS